MPNNENAAESILNFLLKRLSRRRDDIALARTFKRLKKDVLAQPAASQQAYFCERFVRLVGSNGIARKRPMAEEYGEHMARYEAAIEAFLRDRQSAPTVSDWRAFVLNQASTVRKHLARCDVDAVVNARTKATMALHLVYCLHADDGRYPSYEEFSRSVRRALQP